ncbi:hypothetical protein AOCH_002900 [Aspergillus ochraceoroseus]|nr:hypothetical protein AOCH_002900 [Aspergillus ochraceoroseus]
MFIETAQLYRPQASVSSTAIFRALTEFREYSRWSSITSRPSRDISTVIFNKEKKDSILKDINEYLHPQTRRWYANHGIPYRRGYLFTGPPGTAKTSLASAVAGVFGLDIYVLSLLDPTLTESQFVRLFSEVPIEDIDVAGLDRPENPPPVKPEGPGKYASPANTGVSLSSLLNAIDGVSSHEGRILIMTTNAPENLDAALIRPGRVDMRIEFELPGHEELRGLFLSMYSDVGHQGDMTHADLENLANEFVGKVPEKKFSAAEVQGFLLSYKRNPNEACSHVLSWAEESKNSD